MKKRKFTQAFTIIELTTVLVIMMIIASMIVGVGKKSPYCRHGSKGKEHDCGFRDRDKYV